MKQFIKGSSFHCFFPPKFYMLGKGINIFLKIKLVLNLSIIKILRTAGSLLSILTNKVLLINWLLFLIQKIKII